jgi:hypothetical protein
MVAGCKRRNYLMDRRTAHTTTSTESAVLIVDQ